MKRFLILPALLSVSAIASPIGATSNDPTFDTFAYSVNVDRTSMNINFQALGPEFRLILSPSTGFFNAGLFLDRFRVQASAAPNITPAVHPLVNDDDQSNSSFTQGDSRTADDLVLENETDDPPFVSTSGVPEGTSSGGPGLLDQGLTDVEAVVPESPSFALLGVGLLGLGLLRKRTA